MNSNKLKRRQKEYFKGLRVLFVYSGVNNTKGL